MADGTRPHFFAILSRMKHISRWGLMRNTRPENLEEHSYEVALLAHALALIRNKRFDGQVDISKVVLAALYHDASEIYTGDLPTPVKYFNQEIVTAYKQVEGIANRKLLSYLPEDLRPEFETLINDKDEDTAQIIKAADKLSALIKCIEEEKAGNMEFKKAAAAQEEYLRGMGLPEVDCFMSEFLPSYRLTLDEQE